MSVEREFEMTSKRPPGSLDRKDEVVLYLDAHPSDSSDCFMEVAGHYHAGWFTAEQMRKLRDFLIVAYPDGKS